jgi:hypothetical protein
MEKAGEQVRKHERR